MGYVNLKDICKFISPAEMQKTAGTWTPTISTHLVYESRTAAAAGFYVMIPVKLPASNGKKQGGKILSVDIWYKVVIQAMTDFADVVVKKLTLSANGVAVSGAAYTAFSLDADHDTAAERKTVGDHKMTITFTDKPYLEDDEVLYILLSVEGGASGVFNIYGAQANFELKL